MTNDLTKRVEAYLALAEKAQRWPFVESPGDFAERLCAAMRDFPLIGAVRHVLIECPPQVICSHEAAAIIRDQQALIEKLQSQRIGWRCVAGGEVFTTYDAGVAAEWSSDGLAVERFVHSDEQQAEIERLIKDGNYQCRQRVYEWERANKAEAETKRLRKDAERYQWLRDKSANQYEHPIVVSQRKAPFNTMQYIGPVIGVNLDTAIDAAIAKEKEGG